MGNLLQKWNKKTLKSVYSWEKFIRKKGWIILNSGRISNRFCETIHEGIDGGIFGAISGIICGIIVEGFDLKTNGI